ncbi:Nucleosome assembly protein, partial [Thalictrum thalictroides]
TVIEWLPGKSLTQKVLKKKPKKGSKNAKPITKTESCESFFNFFNPPQVPEEEDDIDEETAETLQTQMEQDYDIGSTIRDKIIPHAVSWFTGEANQGDEFEDDDEDDNEEDDDEEEDEEEEDDEDEDEDEDDEEEEDTKSRRKPSAGPKKTGRAQVAEGGERPPESALLQTYHFLAGDCLVNTSVFALESARTASKAYKTASQLDPNALELHTWTGNGYASTGQQLRKAIWQAGGKETADSLRVLKSRRNPHKEDSK